MTLIGEPIKASRSSIREYGRGLGIPKWNVGYCEHDRSLMEGLLRC